MPKDKRGSAGGKARAIIQKQEAKQRVDEYNKNPNLCLFCGKPILAPYDKKLRETKNKKFCSKSCAAKYNNNGKTKNKLGINGQNAILNNITDEEFVSIFNASTSISDFGKRLGYKHKLDFNSKALNNRLFNLGLNIDDLKKVNEQKILNYTKKELFDRYEHWQTARSAIQKNARSIYNNSNKPKKCIVCDYDKHYEVAHIKAVSDFREEDTIADINNIDNLIALCPNHHWEYDNTDFDINQYLYNIN